MTFNITLEGIFHNDITNEHPSYSFKNILKTIFKFKKPKFFVSYQNRVLIIVPVQCDLIKSWCKVLRGPHTSLILVSFTSVIAKIKLERKVLSSGFVAGSK